MSLVSTGLLIYRPGALGDALVALPALAAIPERFGAIRTILATSSVAVPLFSANRVAHVVLTADDTRLLPLFSGRPKAAFDEFGVISAAVLWGGDGLGTVASALAGVGTEVIHAPSQPPEPGVHVAEYLLRTLDSSAVLNPCDVRLQPPADEVLLLTAQYPMLTSTPYLALHPGSGSTQKNWSPRSFAQLANLARTSLGLETVLLSGPADAGLAEHIGASLQKPAVLVARDWPLTRVAAVLSLAALYVGNDSGISHLAGCLGVPGVALFGPTSAKVWSPLGGTILARQGERMDDHVPKEVLESLRSIRTASDTRS
ncbi:MAG: glycosyltransferase family 9 protein [Chloroflexota bacterium]